MANALTYQSEFTGQQMDERFTAVATLTAALEALTGVVAQKYVKPSDGIPSTDMTAAVQASLAKAESAVQSLADYYTKTEVDQLLAAINGMDYVDVSTLPTASASTMGKIYLLGPDSSGYYAYYYTSYDGTSYSWVGPLGTTEISLSNYATKAELNQLDQKVTSITVPGDYEAMTGLTPTTGHAMQTNGTESAAVDGWEYFTIPVKPGEKYKISAYSGWSYRLYVIKSASSVLAVHDYSSSTSLQTAEVTIPDTAVTMYVNTDTRFGSGFYSIQKQGVKVSAKAVVLEDDSTLQDFADTVDRAFAGSPQYTNCIADATLHAGEWMLSGGTTSESSMWRYYTIPAKQGDKFKVNAVAGSSGAPLWLQLNANGGVVSYDTTTTSITENSAEVTIAANVATFVLNARVNSDNEIAKIKMEKQVPVITADMVFKGSTSLATFWESIDPANDPLYGKTLVCCGDSITAGADMDASGIIATPTIDVYQRSGDTFAKQAANYPANYGYQIAARHNMTYYCDGISGSTVQGMSDHSGFSLANGRYTTLPENIDYLLLWFGWNDAAFGSLGTIDDSTNASYYGGWNVVLPYLIDKYTYAKIALLVPFGASANHREAVRLVANKWGVACWDNYQGGTPLYYGKEPAVGVEESIVTANRAKFQANGAHPNFKGHTQLADMIEQFLRGI